MLILGKRLTHVKFPGAFYGIMGKYLNNENYCIIRNMPQNIFPGRPTGKMVIDLPW